ncbi:uncharacterized protein FIBRA_03331 [Fibroporia radiculosa]|uniref:Pseudouridine synthase RsuA/RluA-like domain-containing protein n=1 Tax=Fibroporia radiculosa TaxID=599839 RepID=J4HVX7_9APHY|nr:uncharacterized protein FIBRA_03331 [Fibroporia radiculosa]CCM01282.1 predicted protein [Fibroporia radiculosa]
MQPQAPGTSEASLNPQHAHPGLKKIPSYWYPYTTMAKARWLGREILEVVSTEFRDRSMEYYRYALESGVTTVNGKVAKPDTIIQNGDRIENVVHRHEPPVTSTPVRIILEDKEREFIVINKPGSIPVHASGRYFRNSLVEILKNDFGYQKVYTINRLDRLTSGLMIIPLSASRANTLTQEFAAGTIRKEYIARCKGEFPEEVTCEEPLLTVDRQMGLNIVHPEGKPAKTIFKRMHYDSATDTSVVHCRPLTGRSHQIRVHLQYLGHSIANDPIYSEAKIWGECLGKGGLDLTPSEERAAPAPPDHVSLAESSNPELLSRTPAFAQAVSSSSPNPCDDKPEVDGPRVCHTVEQTEQSSDPPKLLPRETGHDIGMGSPVPLSADMVGVITRLRNMKDEDEDWSRWRDVVFRTKGLLSPYGVKAQPKSGEAHHASEVQGPPQLTKEEVMAKLETFRIPPPPPVLVESSSAASLSPTPAAMSSPGSEPFSPPPSTTTDESPSYCPECYLPLHPDPKPERLYIFLHALRYTTSLGSFETEVPEWAAEGWTWER